MRNCADRGGGTAEARGGGCCCEEEGGGGSGTEEGMRSLARAAPRMDTLADACLPSRPVEHGDGYNHEYLAIREKWEWVLDVPGLVDYFHGELECFVTEISMVAR